MVVCFKLYSSYKFILEWTLKTFLPMNKFTFKTKTKTEHVIKKTEHVLRSAT